MTPFTKIPKQIEEVLSRRNFLQSAGMLVVSVGPLATSALAQAPASGQAGTGRAAGPYPDPNFRQLDSWIVIRQDNTATFYVGKTDCGQGTGTSFRQMMSDELDIPFEKTDIIMGRTDITVDQGGSGGSTAIERDGKPMRLVAVMI